MTEDRLPRLDIPQVIQCHFPLAPVPSVPEIRLHTAQPTSGLWRLAERDESFSTPYWAYHWGGGLALARYVLDHPEIVAERRVLDLGAGSGIVGIAAAKSRARHVTAADIDRYAMAAIALNAAANEVAVSGRLGDLTASPPPAVDVVLAGDLFYEEALSGRVTQFLDRCLDVGIDILIGDPWRAFLPCDRLCVVAEYPGLDFETRGKGAPASNAVFAFKPKARGARR